MIDVYDCRLHRFLIDPPNPRKISVFSEFDLYRPTLPKDLDTTLVFDFRTLIACFWAWQLIARTHGYPKRVELIRCGTYCHDLVHSFHKKSVLASLFCWSEVGLPKRIACLVKVEPPWMQTKSSQCDIIIGTIGTIVNINACCFAQSGRGSVFWRWHTHA